MPLELTQSQKEQSKGCYVLVAYKVFIEGVDVQSLTN